MHTTLDNPQTRFALGRNPGNLPYGLHPASQDKPRAEDRSGVFVSTQMESAMNQIVHNTFVEAVSGSAPKTPSISRLKPKLLQDGEQSHQATCSFDRLGSTAIGPAIPKYGKQLGNGRQ